MTIGNQDPAGPRTPESAAASPVVRDLVILIARLGIAVVFITEGWRKLFIFGIPKTAVAFEQMGVPLPTVSAWFAALVEVVGGSLLVLGLAVSLSGLLLALNMLGAYLTAYAAHGLFLMDDGPDLVIVLCVGSLLLAAVGPGRLSVAYLIGRRPDHG